MELKVNNKKLDIIELNSFIDKLKCLKFNMDKLDYVIKLCNRRFINTYFYCQRIDLILVNNDDEIIKIYNNFKTEKFKLFKRKVKHIYILPLGTAQYYTVGEKMKILDKKKK